MKRLRPISAMVNSVALAALFLTSACAFVDVPDSRNVQIPSPTTADQRRQALNERPDSVMYLPLGEDVLVPDMDDNDVFPSDMVGPFELRGETLAGALQLILADYDISLAFETQEGLSRRVTVANLRGDLGKVVNQVCSLANLYCSYEDGTITVKDTQTFTVALPPIGQSNSSSGSSSSSDSSSSSGGEEETEFLDDVAEGLGAILGPNAEPPIVDPTTRTIVYQATQRTADVASRYFQRLRANTAMIVFETYIWEVSLNSGNSTGVDWFKLAQFGKFDTGISINGSVGADFTNPISIGLPTTGEGFDGTTGDLLQFLSQFGAVKTISQPQVTVLSGSQAELRVADTRNYVSQIATTLSEGQATTAVNTDSVDTGFTLTIGSTWDKSTVYANIELELTDVKQIDDFAFSDDPGGGGTGTQTRIQLPQTSERQLSTQIRVRPGDSILIAGLVRENDSFNEEGVGFMQPFLPQSRTAQTENLELVILLRPRVVVYTAANDKRYVDYALKKHKVPGTPEPEVSEGAVIENRSYRNVVSKPETTLVPVVEAIEEEIPAGMPAPLTSRGGETTNTMTAVPTSQVPARMQNNALPASPAPLISPPPAPTPAPVPLTPVPVPAPVLKQNAAPAPVSSSESEGRFTRGSGFVSTSTYPAASTTGAGKELVIPPKTSTATSPATTPPAPSSDELTPAAPPTNSYQTYE